VREIWQLTALDWWNQYGCPNCRNPLKAGIHTTTNEIKCPHCNFRTEGSDRFYFVKEEHHHHHVETKRHLIFADQTGNQKVGKRWESARDLMKAAKEKLAEAKSLSRKYDESVVPLKTQIVDLKADARRKNARIKSLKDELELAKSGRYLADPKFLKDCGTPLQEHGMPEEITMNLERGAFDL